MLAIWCNLLAILSAFSSTRSWHYTDQMAKRPCIENVKLSWLHQETEWWFIRKITTINISAAKINILNVTLTSLSKDCKSTIPIAGLTVNMKQSPPNLGADGFTIDVTFSEWQNSLSFDKSKYFSFLDLTWIMSTQNLRFFSPTFSTKPFRASVGIVGRDIKKNNFIFQRIRAKLIKNKPSSNIDLVLLNVNHAPDLCRKLLYCGEVQCVCPEPVLLP